MRWKDGCASRASECEMTTRRWLMLALAAAAVLLIAGRALAGVYAEYLWYDSLGAVALWAARMEAVATLRIGSTAAAALFAFANLYAVRQSVVTLVLPRRLGNWEFGEEVPGRYLTATAVVLSLALGVMLALPQRDWMTFELARYGKPFGEVDPYHLKDLGFFVYWLPFESSLWTWAFFSILIIAVAVIALYALTPSLKWQQGSLRASTYVRRHFTVIIGVLLLMLAWSFRLDMYALLLDGTGPDGVFGYVDHKVGIPGDLMLSLATLGAALIVIWAGFAGQFRLAGVSVITIVALSLVVREVVPAIVRHSGTDAERKERDTPYLGTRATYTRRAFAGEPPQQADSSIAYPSLTAALPWVPIWDPPALARAIDGGRAGDLASVRIGWHASGAGVVGDVVDPPPPGAAARAPWTLARIIGASADERGAPLRVAGPSASAIDDIPLDAPLVYPGAKSYAVISDSLSLNTGTSLENGLARLAYAWALQNFRLLSNDAGLARPKIVVHRDVSERIERLAPFFVQGGRIEPLLVGDSLYWGVDLYTASNTYPLSSRVTILGEERSYLRHAAVAIVDASTGEISVVPDSTTDRIASTWKQLLQSIFGTWNTLPPELPSLLPPPIDGVSAQALAFGRYGTKADPGSSPRHVPTLDGADSSLVTDPLPIVLPGARTTSLALPLVGEDDQLRGLFIGTGGTARTTMWYPLSAPGPRWSAILDGLRSVDSAGTAAREGPLVAGRVRSVPVHSGIGFLQPRYRWRQPNPPSMYRVALRDDSSRSLSPNIAPSRPEEAPTPGDLRKTIAALYST